MCCNCPFYSHPVFFPTKLCHECNLNCISPIFNTFILHAMLGTSHQAIVSQMEGQGSCCYTYCQCLWEGCPSHRACLMLAHFHNCIQFCFTFKSSKVHSLHCYIASCHISLCTIIWVIILRMDETLWVLLHNQGAHVDDRALLSSIIQYSNNDPDLATNSCN